MNAEAAFYLGVIAASVVWFVLLRRQDRRIDRDIEARLMALDRERIWRIFGRHTQRCACGRSIMVSLDEDAAVRDAEWNK